MIGCNGLQKLTKLMTALDANTQYQEIAIAPHVSKPNTVCFEHVRSNRGFQAQLLNNYNVLEIDYLSADGKACLITVDDVTSIVKRIMAYFNGQSKNI